MNKALRILSIIAAVVSGVGVAVAGAVHQLPASWQANALAGVGVLSVAGVAMTTVIAEVRAVEANASVVASGQVPAALIPAQPSVASPDSPLGNSGNAPTNVAPVAVPTPAPTVGEINADLGVTA